MIIKPIYNLWPYISNCKAWLILEEQQNINSIQREIYLGNSLHPSLLASFHGKTELCLRGLKSLLNFHESHT